MQRSDIEVVAKSYIRALWRDRNLRRVHAALITEAGLVDLVNRTLGLTTPLALGDLPAFEDYINHTSDADTRRFDATIRNVSPQDHHCLTTGPPPYHGFDGDGGGGG